MTKRKKKKRPRCEIYGLSKNNTHWPARAHLDFDYVKNLSEKERNWLARFSAEYYQNTFENNPKDLHQAGTEERRECYRREHARNRDLFTHVPLESLEDIENGKDKDE